MLAHLRQVLANMQAVSRQGEAWAASVGPQWGSFLRRFVKTWKVI